MKKLLSVVGLSLLAVALSGCASYSHQHLADGTDKTAFNSFLMFGKAGKIHTNTKAATNNVWSRIVSVGSIEGQGDAEMLKALYEAGVAAGSKAVKP